MQSTERFNNWKICGDRVQLEPQVPAHADEMYELLLDPSIYRYLDESPPESPDKLRDRYRYLEACQSPDGMETWLNWIVRGTEGAALGYVQATIYSGKVGEIAYVFASKYWGAGLAYESCKLMLDHLVQRLEICVIYATTSKANVRSRTLLARLGFRVIDPQTYPFGELPEQDEAWGLDLRKAHFQSPQGF